MADEQQRGDTEQVRTANGEVKGENTFILCLVCFEEKPKDSFVTFSNCRHSFCSECIRHAFRDKVNESRVKLQCLRCSSEVTQQEFEHICDEELHQKYLDACLNRYLATTPNVRYCRAPDCPFACVDTSTSLHTTIVEEHFMCHREECRREFCNSCNQPWHEGKTCQEVRDEMPVEVRQLTDEIERIEAEIKKSTKECPRCHNKIEKMKDTCNMVVCWYCELKFCWLCGQEVNDWHFFSPTGCTLYGSSPWSHRRLRCCRFWMWATAPILLLVLSFLVYPASLVLVPVGLAFLVYYVLSKRVISKRGKVCLVISIIITVLLSILFDVVLALLLTIAFYVVGLIYVYCCMPLALVLQYNNAALPVDLEQGLAD